MAQAVVGKAEQSQVSRLGAAAFRDRQQVVDLQGRGNIGGGELCGISDRAIVECPAVPLALRRSERTDSE